MKLDPNALRYLSDDDFRVLTAVEMGMKNHEVVPVPLITVISGLRHGGAIKCLREVHRHKLVHREAKRYEGYRLTYLGYDYLAMRALSKRSVLKSVGRGIGMGKEADVFIVTTGSSEDDIEDKEVAMKIHRLGRTSFRAVKNKRDYMQHRQAASWLYMSRLAAVREYTYMQALYQRGFSVPEPIGHSRHICVMELVGGVLLNQVREMEDPAAVAENLLGFLVRLAEHGLVHCDLNEFNVIVDDDGETTVIDFPQMISIEHPDAKSLFERDYEGIAKFFEYRFGLQREELPNVSFEDACQNAQECDRIDREVATGLLGKPGDEKNSHEKEMISLEGKEPETMKNAQLRSNDESRNTDVDNKQGALDSAAIATKVRKYRANRARRKLVSKRNITRSSDLRKIQREVKGETIWN